jgi:hypothetical protein
MAQVEQLVGAAPAGAHDRPEPCRNDMWYKVIIATGYKSDVHFGQCWHSCRKTFYKLSSNSGSAGCGHLVSDAEDR